MAHFGESSSSSSFCHQAFKDCGLYQYNLSATSEKQFLFTSEYFLSGRIRSQTTENF